MPFRTKNQQIAEITGLDFPKKVIREIDETDENFVSRTAEFYRLRKEYARAYAKAKLSLETDEQREARRRKARFEDDPEKRAAYIEKEHLRSQTRKDARKIYSQKNSEVLRIKRKARYDINKLDPKFIEKHRIRKRKEHENRKNTDVQYITKRALRTSLYNNIRSYSNGWKCESIGNLIGCSMDQFINYIESKFEPGMSWTNRNFHLDHIRPCSSFDLTDVEQQKLCFHYTNYQPLWPVENLQKNAKLDWQRNLLTSQEDGDSLQDQPHNVVRESKEE